MLTAARASGHEPHDDEDDHRNQRNDEERLQRCEEPARNRDGKPDGKDYAEDCPDDPAHVPSMRLATPGTRRIVLGRLGPAESVRATQA